MIRNKIGLTHRLERFIIEISDIIKSMNTINNRLIKFEIDNQASTEDHIRIFRAADKYKLRLNYSVTGDIPHFCLCSQVLDICFAVEDNNEKNNE